MDRYINHSDIATNVMGHKPSSLNVCLHNDKLRQASYPHPILLIMLFNSPFGTDGGKGINSGEI